MPCVCCLFSAFDNFEQVMSCASSPEAFPCYDHVITPKSAGVVSRSLLEGLASMDVETAAPFIAPLLVVLKETGRAVEKAALNGIELGELLAHCTNITGNVIQKARADSSSVDVSPLQKHIEELKKVAELCGQKNTSASAARRLSDRIQNLRMRIDVINIWHKVEDFSQTPVSSALLDCVTEQRLVAVRVRLACIPQFSCSRIQPSCYIGV